MRTTLTMDDDLAERLVELAREKRQSFKTVVNEVIRRGLGDPMPAVTPFDYQAHPGNLRVGIDDRRLNELAWDLDEARFAAGLAGKRR